MSTSNRRANLRLRPVRLLILSVAVTAMVTAMVPARADDAGDEFAVAAGHYAGQRWKLATGAFQAFLEKHPNHPKANEGIFLAAEALLQTGKSEEAGTWFRQYLNREPSGKYTRAALFRAGEAAYLAGKSELAKADLDRFLSTYPNDKLNAYVLPYLGDIALGQEDATAAVKYFHAGATEFPQGKLLDDCHFGLARALERQDRNEEAVRFYRAVAVRPGAALADDARFHLGALQYATGNYQQAVQTFAAFETQLAQSPWQPNARLGRSWALLKLNRLDEAKSALAGITSDPKVGMEARYWLGLAQKADKDWAAAAKTLQAAAAAAGAGHELTPVIRFHAGDALRRSGDGKAAHEQFDLVIASGAPGNEWVDDAMHGKIQVALEAEDYQTVDRQAAEFEKRFSESSLKGDVHRMRAQSLLKRKQHGEALKLLEPLTSAGILDEQARADRYLLAQAYEGLEQYDEALAVLLPVLDAADARLRSDAQLTQGSLLVAVGRYADAVAPLQAFLADDPGGDGAIKGRGELAICYARTDRLDEAKKTYAKLLEEHPDHTLIVPITEQLAEAAYEAKDTQWSNQLFNRLQTAGGSTENELKGLAGLGWSQFQAGRLEEAAVAFEKLLSKEPPAAMAAEAALVRGRILEQLNRPDPALAMYDLVLDKYPKTSQRPTAMLAAARLRDRLQQDQEAAVLYERLTKEHPQIPEIDAVLYEWAWVLHDLNKTTQSNELFERLRKEHRQSRYWADATYRLAVQAFEAKDYARARELTSEALAVRSDARIREYALYLRGQIAVAEEDWKQVAETFASLAKEFPEGPRRLLAEYWVAETTYRRGDYAAAGELFDRLAQQTRGRRQPWLAMVPLRRAQSLAQLKKWNEAYAVAAKIEGEFPDFQQQYEADYLIGRCLSARGDFDGARKAYQKVIHSPAGEKTETAAMAQWMIGETYFHQKNYEAAVKEFWKVKILYAYPVWQAGAMLQAGKCHELLGERKEAAAAYTQLLKAYPDTTFAEQARQRLESLPEHQAGIDP